MALGPVQVLVVGYGTDAQFKGEALDELKKLMDADIVRLVDLLVVHKNDDGSIDKVEISDVDELEKVGAVAGAEAVEGGSMFDPDQVWFIADAIPEGMTAAVAVLEHRWAIPLRDAIARSGGMALADEWIHPQDLIELGIEASEA